MVFDGSLVVEHNVDDHSVGPFLWIRTFGPPTQEHILERLIPFTYTPCAPPIARGAGIGCVTPFTTANAPRAIRCGCCGVSHMDSTGVTQASSASNTCSH
ncbi:hypothetical protein ALDI51_04170 [Alicycliphilus denitrificans]|nr:hypothetical protein ALDI51_04170 [Alicycliphilus denitrificans]